MQVALERVTRGRLAAAILVAGSAAVAVRRNTVAFSALPAAILLAGSAAVAPAPAQHRVAGEDVMAAADAQRAVPLPLARLAGPIRVDGVIDEPAWDAVPALPMVMHSPAFLGTPTERTEVRIAYDDRYLYVSGRMYDSDRAGIRTNTFYRDAYSGDDLLAIVIDSYNDHETAVWFATNPAGARTDRTVSNDAVFSGGMPMNSDWNAHWDVATTRTDEGWFAEFRIPFSTLGFQVVDDRVVMGVIVYRFIARKNERLTFPAIDPAWGGLAFAKPSQAQRILLEGVRQTRPVYITPYVLGGVRQAPVLREPATGPAGWRTASDGSHEAGVDLRWAPTSNLALDLTVNTDFAQVEADDQQINLTRFPLFFPEKRQFFQERASTFQFSTGGFTDRLFHSRRIGLAGGEIVRIYGGARAVGRVGGLDYGVLSMQTAAHDGRSSENLGVVRLKQQVLNRYSSVGAMLTTRLGTAGGDNIAYGLDAALRLVGDEWLTLRWAQTFDAAIDEASTLEAGLLQARWERAHDGGLSYAGEFRRVGRDYLPGLGFQARRDFRYYGGRVQYRRFQSADSPLRSAAAGLRTEHYIRGADGTAETRVIEPDLAIELKDGTELRLTGRSVYESVSRDFAVAGMTVPAGDYRFHLGEVELELPRSGLFRGEVSATAGTFYDGTRLGLALGPAWNPSRYLELGGGYEVNRLAFEARDQTATAHLVRLRLQLALNTRVSLNTFGQYSNVADLATFNVRFRYHVREGTDLWIVYNEGLNTERDLGPPPRLPRSAGRIVMVKYTHTLIR
jgi:hypothetical protein